MGMGPKYRFSGFMICGLCGVRMITVSGDVELFNALGDSGMCVTVMVARDGIEPPPPAFSECKSSKTNIPVDWSLSSISGDQ